MLTSQLSMPKLAQCFSEPMPPDEPEVRARISKEDKQRLDVAASMLERSQASIVQDALHTWLNANWGEVEKRLQELRKPFKPPSG